MERIEIVKYNPKWKELFKIERNKLKNIIDDAVTIAHIGSTSIEGLDAKPIIDISVGVKDFREVSYYEELLQDYSHLNGYKMEGWYLFGKTDENGQKYHLHIMHYQSKRLFDQVLFKLYIENNKKAAENYVWLKHYYAEHDDQVFYSMNKLPFVENIVKAAYAYYGLKE